MANNREIENILKERQEIEPLPFILSVAACAFLLLSGLFALIFTGFVMNMIKKASPETTLNLVNITLLSVAWLALSYALFIAVYNLKRKATRDWMYFMMITGILTVLTANILAGILIVISSVLLLIRDTKLKDKIEK